MRGVLLHVQEAGESGSERQPDLWPSSLTAEEAHRDGGCEGRGVVMLNSQNLCFFVRNAERLVENGISLSSLDKNEISLI